MISCNHWSPSGASVTSCVSCGFTHSGSAARAAIVARAIPEAERNYCAGAASAWQMAVRLGSKGSGPEAEAGISARECAAGIPEYRLIAQPVEDFSRTRG
jgi:hypothetical protein